MMNHIFLDRRVCILACTLMIAYSACDVNDGPHTETSEFLIGFSGQDVATSIAEAPDGYFIVGQTNSIRNQPDVYIAKVSRSFEVIWSKSFGGSSPDAANQVIANDVGGCTVIGTIAATPGNDEVVVMSLDREGAILWTWQFGFLDRDQGNAIVRNSDDSYTICGTVHIGPTDRQQIFLARISNTGHTMWTSMYGSNDQEFGHSLASAPDGGFVVTGYRSFVAAPTTEWNVLLVKFSANGAPQWEREFNRFPIDQGMVVRPTPTGGFIVGAQAEVRGIGADVDNWLIATDENGNLLWDLVISESVEDRLYNLCITHDDAYLIAGYANLSGINLQAHLSRVTLDGGLVWSHVFGSSASDVLRSVLIDSRGATVAVGYTQRKGNSDIYIVRPDDSGNLLEE